MKEKDRMPVKSSDSAFALATQYHARRRELMEQCLQPRHTIHRIDDEHKNRISKIAFSADGRRLFTAGWDGLAICWDLESGLPQITYSGHSGPLQDICLLPGEDGLITGSDDGTVKLWNLENAACLYTFSCHQGGVSFAQVTPDAKEMVTGGRDALATLWSLETRQPICHYIGHQDNVSYAIISADGSRVITASYDGQIMIWERLTGKLVRTIKEHSCANKISLASNGSILAGYASNEVILWSIEDGTALFRHRLHSTSLMRVSRDDDRNSNKKLSYVDDCQVNEKATQLAMVSSCSAVLAVPQADYYFSTGWDKTCRQVDFSGQEINCFRGHDASVDAVALSPCGDFVATGSWDGECRLWSVKNGETVKILKAQSTPILSIALNPGGNCLLTAGGKNAKSWDLNDGRDRLSFIGHTNNINRVRTSPDGKFALTAGSDGYALLWNLSTGLQEAQFESPAPLSDAVFAPDLSKVAIGGFDGKTLIFDFKSRSLLSSVSGYFKGISELLFTPDSEKILIASGDKIVSLIDTITGRCILQLNHPAAVRSVDLSDNGHLAAGCINGEIHIWELAQDRPIAILKAHEGIVHTVKFSRDGDQLFSAGADRLIKACQWRGEQVLAIGRGHRDEVTTLAIAPCDTRIYSGSYDHTVCCWDWNGLKYSMEEAGKINPALTLLATLYHLENGFLWMTPPAEEESAQCGWFWTDREELIRVLSGSAASDNESPVEGAEREEYFRLFCRQEMVMTRLTAPAKNRELLYRLNEACKGLKKDSLTGFDGFYHRRLEAPRGKK